MVKEVIEEQKNAEEEELPDLTEEEACSRSNQRRSSTRRSLKRSRRRSRRES